MPNEDKTPEQPTKTGRRPGPDLPKTTRPGRLWTRGGITTKSTRFDPSLDIKTDDVIDSKTTTTRDPTPSPPTITTRCTTGDECYSTPTN